MAFVTVGLQRLLPLASIGDGLLPSRRIRHALTLLGPAVSDIVILLGREHHPHDREPAVDVFGDGGGVDLSAERLELPAAARDGVLGSGGDGNDRSPSASTALAGHGEDIHVGGYAHVAHGALPGSRGAIALGPLIHHGDVLQDDVAVGPFLYAGLSPREEFGVGDTAAASLVGGLHGKNAQGDILVLRSSEQERVTIPVPAAYDFARRLSLTHAAHGRLTEELSQLLFQIFGIIGDGLLVILDLLVTSLGLGLVLDVPG